MNVLAPSRPPAAIPAPALVVDTAGFEAWPWLQTARPGSLIEYHRGHLCVDRQQRFDAPHDAPDNEPRAALNDLADRAMRAAEQGLVHLVQRRHGPADFSYLAIKSRPSVRVSRFEKSSWQKHEEPKHERRR